MEIGRYDTAISPTSLAEQVKGAAFKKAVAKVSPHLFEQSEDILESQLRPTGMDYQLKESFWIEYQRARLQNRKMDTKNIYGPICTYTHFYNNILNSPPKLAWILSPISGVLHKLPGFQELITGNIFDILRADNCYKNGKPNLRIMDAHIKLFKILTEYMVDPSTYNGEGGEGMSPVPRRRVYP